MTGNKITGIPNLITPFEILTGYKMSLLLNPITIFKIFAGYNMPLCLILLPFTKNAVTNLNTVAC